VLTSAAARRAFDRGGEDERLRERYGRHKYGQSLLLADHFLRCVREFAALGSGVEYRNRERKRGTSYSGKREHRT
jgi:hypothetical protein